MQFYFQNLIFQRAKMPAHSSVKASDSYDSLYNIAEFVVVSRHLAFEATPLHTFPFLHPVSKPPQRPTPQPLPRFEIPFLEVTQLDASYTLV